ncbi:MAG TPA: M48 family metalloprotease [Candidatus Aminicenantes bacterium]|nr:M48 family metalloprotease [Candidatus Aminicenantes bacterium]HPT00517.1 M48 family metalloprotease [Candidatus Aminicenantes bacterium]
MKSFLALLLFLLFSLSCAVNPVTGENEVMLFSEKAEVSMGADVDRSISQEYGLYQDPLLTRYIERVGRRLVPHTHRPNLVYHFSVLDTPVINAFAAPGGYIYVTRGILALMNSEAEMAAVLGHELGHVNARHSMRQMSNAILLNTGLLAASLINKKVARFAGLASVGVQLLLLKYSRDDEYQADSLGVEYARKAGYNPGEVIDFFLSLEKLGDMSGSARVPGFLSTHPLTKNRINRARTLILPEDGRMLMERELYLSSINGMVYGENPKSGYLEGRTFYYPEMGISLVLPEGWQAEASPRRITLSSADGKGAYLLERNDNPVDLPTTVAKKAESLGKVRLLDQEKNPMDTFPSLRCRYSLLQEDSLLAVDVTGFRQENRVVTLTALSEEKDYRTLSGAFRSLAMSIKPISDQRKVKRQPQRILLRKADGETELRELFRREGVEEKKWPFLALLNSLELNSRPERGTLIKVVR